MAKTKKMTVKEAIKQVWKADNKVYKDMWKASWNEYKTIIGPFIKGTAAYARNLVYGSLAYIGRGIYGTGKILIDWLMAIIVKA